MRATVRNGLFLNNVTFICFILTLAAHKGTLTCVYVSPFRVLAPINAEAMPKPAC